MSYVRTLTICPLLAYFVSAAGCHCFDLYDIPGSVLLLLGSFDSSAFLWGLGACPVVGCPAFESVELSFTEMLLGLGLE